MTRRRVLAALGLLLVTAVAALEDRHKRPFRSIKAPKETIVNYEAVFPEITYRDSKQAHPKLLHISIMTQRGSYSLILEQNEQLISPSFTSRSFDENGEEVVAKGSYGNQRDKDNFFHLEPLSREDGAIEQLHAVYLDSEYEHKQGNCGSNHSHYISSDQVDWPSLGQPYGHNRLRRQSTSRRIVEWIAVNDNRQYTANGRNLSATVMRALAVANEVDSLYRTQFMIRIVLIESITWTSSDQITVSYDAETLLNTFQEYRRRNIITPHDSAMLLTGIEIAGTTVGIAFTSEMCSNTHSVGVTQDGGNSLSSTASIAAHELGHIFNMRHDDSVRQCTCADGDQGCIMAAVSGSPPPTRWSSCSVSDLKDGFTMNLDRCLFNEPSMTVGDPVCGNGIRERDEICDCGSPQECTDPCCNATSCQLAGDAQCSAGDCCTSNCQFVSYGTQCRAASGECDIAEYCSGDSFECPSDDTKLDGTSCNGNSSYCYSGRCPSHNAQCQKAFDSNKAVDRCYDDYNIQGNQGGNCGHTSTAFRPCSASDVQCGQLQCMAGDFQASNFIVSVNITTITIGSITCRSFTTSPGSNVDTPSPGLVEDGTQCGDGLICQSQRCIPVSQITTLSCDTAPDGIICSGNGVCNNRGECSCNVGFAGANCETPFSGPGGGSQEGGQSQDNAGVIAGAIIGTLLGLALLAGVIVGIILIVIRLRNKKHYTPPTRTSHIKTPRTTTPSVNVVQPGKCNVGRLAPSRPTPSAPPSYDIVTNSSTRNVRPAPPKPVSRPPPPTKPPSHSPHPPIKPPPPVNRPGVKPHPTSFAAKPRTQAAPNSTKVQGRWPPVSVDNNDRAKPVPPSKKPIIPPR